MKKLLFDLFPLILFFIAFRNFDIYTATAVTIVAVFAQIAWLKLRQKPLKPPTGSIWVSSLFLVVLHFFFQNEAFIKWKPTVLYWLFASILIGSHLILRRNLMQKIMGGQIVLPAKVWDKMNYSWALFLLCREP